MRNSGRFFLLLCSVAFFSACTMVHPPSYQLPSSADIMEGERIVVLPGENLYTISKKYKVKLNEIIVVNKFTPPYRVKVGDTIALPTRKTYDAPSPKASPVVPVDRKALKTSLEEAVTVMPIEPLSEERHVSQPPREKIAVAPDVVVTPLQQPENLLPKKSNIPQKPVQLGVPAFAWPVRGTIISAFGPKGKGRDNDGVNIAAPKDSPVKAAEKGTVVYADNKMKGFGNLVLIRHDGGWVTAYAHLGRIVVVRDGVVSKGDVIGTVGTTGGVSSPQLHFETRRDGKPTDPELVVR